MKDKASGGGGGWGTAFLGVTLGLGIVVGMRSFAIDWCWISHQNDSFGRGELGLKGVWQGRGGSGKGEHVRSEVK
jgi:hypothetical protein